MTAVTESDPGSTLKLSICPVRVCDGLCIDGINAVEEKVEVELIDLSAASQVIFEEVMEGISIHSIMLDDVGSWD